MSERNDPSDVLFTLDDEHPTGRMRPARDDRPVDLRDEIESDEEELRRPVVDDDPLTRD